MVVRLRRGTGGLHRADLFREHRLFNFLAGLLDRIQHEGLAQMLVVLFQAADFGADVFQPLGAFRGDQVAPVQIKPEPLLAQPASHALLLGR